MLRSFVSRTTTAEAAATTSSEPNGESAKATSDNNTSVPSTPSRCDVSSSNSGEAETSANFQTDGSVGDTDGGWPRLRHRCSALPRAIRDEVRLFATDFNERLKSALFEATYSCYYAAALPLAFANSAAHFDVTFCVQHVLLVWCATLVYAAARRFPLTYLVELHRAANHLGTWTPLEAANNKSEKPFYMLVLSVFSAVSLVRSFF